MTIDDNLISYLEDLSCLTLSDSEKQRLKGDLQDILGYMARLGGIDTKDVPERSHPFDETNGEVFCNAFRDDEVKDSFDRELILRNAPQRNDEAFIAPRTVN